MNSIVRAWKDVAYRQSISVEEQVMLPANPAGEIELADAELEAIFGAQDCKKDDGPNGQEITCVASASATMTQEGTVLGTSQIVLVLPFVGAVPVSTQKNSKPCIASADASPHR